MNISFPVTVAISNRKKAVTKTYRAILPDYNILEVYKGFVYDGASIPRISWSIIGSPFTGKYQRAAFIHDAIYGIEAFSRLKCDNIFLDIMEEHGCNYIQRHLIYRAVRLFGGLVWKKHTVDTINENMKFVRIFIRSA